MPKNLEEMIAEAVEVAGSKGWRERPVPFPQAVALLHSEASEALEAWRQWGFDDMTGRRHWWWRRGRLPKPEGIGSEFADLFIRLLHYCEVYNVDLRAEYERKMAYNRTRERYHGNRRV